MKKLLMIVLIFLLISMLGIFEIAYAATEIGVTFTVHAAQGQTVYPDYPDFSYLIGKGLTKDDFDITYWVSTNPNNTDFVFDENGALTLSDTVAIANGYSGYMMYIQYTPKRPGVGKETIFRCDLEVYSKISEIKVDKERIIIQLSGSSDWFEVNVPRGTYEDWLTDISYDSDIIEVSIQPSGIAQDKYVFVRPKAPGETMLVLTAFNGTSVSIPVKVTAAPTKVEFAQMGFTAQLGEVVDLGLDLGNGSLEPMPNIQVTVDGTTWSGTYNYGDRYYFPDDASHFHACTTGDHLIKVTTLNQVVGTVWVSVHDVVKCTSIEVDAAKIYARNPVRVITRDANGTEVASPITITKGADFARMEGNQLIADHAGEVELTVYNSDGTVCSQTFQVEVTPTEIILPETEITLEIGENYDIQVGFDQGSMPYTIALGKQTVTEFNLAATRMKGECIIAQAPGTATYVIRAGDLSQTLTVTIPDSDRAVYLVAPSNPYPAKHNFQFAVKDKGGRTYPAVFELDVHHTSYASITKDGFFTSKQIGYAPITATLEDGRQLSITLEMIHMPLWLQHGAVVVHMNSKYSLRPQSDVGGIAASEVTAVVDDESIAKVENGHIVPLKVGKTTVTITSITTGVSTTFTVEVIKADDKVFVGDTTLKVPYGYTVMLPIVTDANGNEVTYTWKITYDNPGVGNPESSGFILDGKELTCVWPSASCEITGTRKYGSGTVKVSAIGYLLPSVIFIEPAVARIAVGDVCYATLNWLDSNCQVEDVYWFSEDTNIVTCHDHTTGRGGLHLRGVKPGVARVIAMVTEELYAVCYVEVYDPNARMPGDANKDGGVNLDDVLCILRQDSSINSSNANVNGDDVVDLDDALLMMQYCAGWSVSLQ